MIISYICAAPTYLLGVPALHFHAQQVSPGPPDVLVASTRQQAERGN